jgi:hypothetical protein
MVRISKVPLGHSVPRCCCTPTVLIVVSKVSVFYQFGFEFEWGTYPWRSHVMQNTSDWLGPYNLVLPQHSLYMESRYVTTIATDYLSAPPNQTIVEPNLFDQYAGATAVHYSIQQQVNLRPTQDPYHDHAETCDHGDIHPILPRLSLQHSQQKVLQFDFMLLSLPSSSSKDHPLSKAWPTLQNHLPDMGISGPYCFQGHLGAYAINASYHYGSAGGGSSNNHDNNTDTSNWKIIPGCVTGLPCWPSEHPPTPHGGGGGNDGPPSNSNVALKIWHEYGVYILLLLLVISMTMNCQLSYRVQQDRRRGGGGEQEELPSTDGRPPPMLAPLRQRRIISRRLVSSMPENSGHILSGVDATTTAAETASLLTEPLLSSNDDSRLAADGAGVEPVDQC